jgi:hypothetical protein
MLDAAAASASRRATTRDVAPLLAIGAPLALLAVALALVAPSLVVQDSWLALVAGREVAEHGLPHADHLTALASGHRWIDQQWLAQLILFEATRLGGVGVAFALCILATLAAFALLFHVAYRRGCSPVALLVFLPLAVGASPWGLQLRTQSFALPLFALVLWLLERNAPLAALPAIAVWANVHGSAVIGVALLAAYAAARRSRRALVAAALAPLALLASPYALDLPGYYRLMLVDPPFGHAIREWNRTTPSGLTALFFLLVAVAVALALLRRGRLTLFDRLVLALTIVLGLDAMRGIVWFGLAALALLPPLATRRPGAARFEGSAATLFVLVAAVTVAGAIAVAAARPAHAYERRFPAALLPVVARSAAGGVVFADEPTADWLLWRLPSLRGRIAYDVRFEILTRPQIARLIAWHGFGRGWSAVPGPASVVVDDPRHVSRLVATGRWRRVLAGATFAVAERLP